VAKVQEPAISNPGPGGEVELGVEQTLGGLALLRCDRLLFWFPGQPEVRLMIQPNAKRGTFN